MSDVLGLEIPDIFSLPPRTPPLNPREDVRDSGTKTEKNGSEDTFEDIDLTTPSPATQKEHSKEIPGISSKKVEEVEKKLSHKNGPIRVYVDMVGDLFHAGHVKFLKTVRNTVAKEIGNEDIYMIVGITNDADVIPYKRKPISSMEERVTSIEACRYVNEVIPNSPMETTEDFIKEHNIDIVAHGDDFNLEKLRKYYKDPIELGIFRTVPYGHGVSTSDLIRRAAESYNSNFADSDHEEVDETKAQEIPSTSDSVQLTGQA